ncbi:MAG TPA: hypothetical protein DCS23_03625 [Candidatus Yonathbacteria bacterium]|nr:hypothetical protein [Candidatus Yonathbacteria bacterium]
MGATGAFPFEKGNNGESADSRPGCYPKYKIQYGTSVSIFSAVVSLTRGFTLGIRLGHFR